MSESIIFPETYRNCFQVPHYICSIIICIIFYIIAIVGFTLSIVATGFVTEVYGVGEYPTQIVVCGCIMTIIIAIQNCFLAYGVAKEWALFLLIWVIVSIIIWNLHLILVFFSFVLVMWRTNRTALDYTRVFVLFAFQFLWLFLIIMVGRHWYAICEEIYQQEYGALPRGVNRRIYTMSNRSRMSHYSTRIPTVLHRIERDHHRRN